MSRHHGNGITTMSKLTHIKESGEAHMVDVGGKPATAREAIAEGRIRMRPATLRLILEGGHPKGDVLAVARIAGIMAAKKTAELVPLCHPVALTRVEVELTADEQQNLVHCRATAATVGPTGVEMEALTAVQISLLTLYDMCKAVDRGMTMTEIGLVSKTGVKSGTWTRST